MSEGAREVLHSRIHRYLLFGTSYDIIIQNRVLLHNNEHEHEHEGCEDVSYV
jgi:hypothetical protein